MGGGSVWLTETTIKRAASTISPAIQANPANRAVHPQADLEKFPRASRRRPRFLVTVRWADGLVVR